MALGTGQWLRERGKVMAAKATHRGTCQCCGHFQKLPSGCLSKHGYHKTWGCFMGVCPGTSQLPLEVSCDYIHACIARAEKSIEVLKGLIEQVKQATFEAVPVQEYVPATWQSRKSYTRWTTGTLSEDGRTITFKTVAGKVEHKRSDWTVGDIEGTWRDRALRHAVRSRVRAYEVEVKRNQEYIAWQQERVATWKPGTLEPIESGEVVRS